MSLTLLNIVIVFTATIKISDQLVADLCFKRNRDLFCGMDMRGELNYTFTLSSLTVFLSRNETLLRDREKADDRARCTDIKADCSLNIRESNLRSYEDILQEAFTTIKNNCNGKTACNIVVPNYSGIKLEKVEPNCPKADSPYYLKSFYLDLKCNFPVPPTTEEPRPSEKDATGEPSSSSQTTTQSVTEPPTTAPQLSANTTEDAKTAAKTTIKVIGPQRATPVPSSANQIIYTSYLWITGFLFLRF